MSAIRVTPMMSHQDLRLVLMGLGSKAIGGLRWDQTNTRNTPPDEDCQLGNLGPSNSIYKYPLRLIVLVWRFLVKI